MMNEDTVDKILEKHHISREEYEERFFDWKPKMSKGEPPSPEEKAHADEVIAKVMKKFEMVENGA
jgi:hypothetical protein